jgi:hypothetical protein
MSSRQAALVLGASGSVDNALIKELIRGGSFKRSCLPPALIPPRRRPDQAAGMAATPV